MGEELWVKTLCPQEVHTSYRKQSTWKRWEGALSLSLIHHLSDSNAELNKHPGSDLLCDGTAVTMESRTRDAAMASHKESVTV